MTVPNRLESSQTQTQVDGYLTSHLQRHVGLAIAYNVMQYFEVSGDFVFLEQEVPKSSSKSPVALRA